MRAVQVCRPYERAGQFPVGTLIRPLRGRLSLPPLAFGHFPLTGGRLTDDRKSRPYGCHPNSAAGAHPRVASLGLRPATLPYGITETVAELGRAVRARRRPKAAPTVEIEPGAFARPGQARK